MKRIKHSCLIIVGLLLCFAGNSEALNLSYPGPHFGHHLLSFGTAG